MIRAAIVGLGRWGRSLVRSVQGQSEEICFVAAHTRTRATAEAFCNENGLTLVEGYGQILADHRVDAVVLATPHSQHAAQVIEAAAARKHIFVEKPITLDRVSADCAVAAAQSAGVVLAVGFARRFHPAIVELRDRLRKGELGTIAAMVGQHTTSTAAFIPENNWRADPGESPAGALTAVGVHLLDHMVEFAGRVREILCVTRRYASGPADDTTTIMLRFESGVTGTIFCSVATATNFSFAVHGSKGLAEISRPDLQRFRFVPPSDQPPIGAVTAPPDEIIEYPPFDTLKAELIEFARCARQNRSYPISIDDVLHGVSVFEALVQSAGTGKIVAVCETIM
jgi:predicted dehydrogenase